MDDFMKKWREEAEAKRDIERKKLLAISDVDALKLSHPDQYQRMRYQREIEAAEWLEEVRKGIPLETKEKPLSKKYKKSNKIVYLYKDD